MYEIKRQDTTGLFIVVDTDTGKVLGRGEAPQTAINFAIERGMPADNKNLLLGEAQTIVETENSVQEQPAQTASQVASDDGPQGPTKTPPQTLNAEGRIVAPPAVTEPSNAIPPTTTETQEGATTGTDDPVVTTEQSQATYYENDGTASSTGPVSETYYENDGTPSSSAVVESGTSTNDDAGTTTVTSNQVDTNAANNTSIKVTAQPNILDDYYSYTYAASLYLLKPEQYTRLINSKNKKIDGYNLLIQSGGAPTNVGGKRDAPVGAAGTTVYENDGSASTVPADPTYPDGGRSPFFPNDFYFDSITIDNQVLGKGTGAAHMASSIKFTIIEPQGITLLDRLYEAVANNEPKDGAGKINYTAATYLMVIRFYGYDQDGNLQLPIKGGLITGSNTSDPKAVVEKFIPFQLTRVNWSIGSKTVSYDFEGAPIGQIQGGYTSRGTIPYDVQLADSTVGGLLGANVKYAPEAPPAASPGANTTTDANGRQNSSGDPRVTGNNATSGQAPAKATAAPTTKKTITQGLMGAMNLFQQELVQKGVYDIADEYSIEFIGVEGLAAAKEIEGAKLQLANTTIDKGRTPMPKPATKSGGTQNLDPDKTAVDNVGRTFSITAGQQILQAIELAIRNSEYISKQSLVTVNPDGSQEVNVTGNNPVKWFNITMSAERQPGGLDAKRNDYAYKIKYTVMPYALKNLDSQYFPYSKFSGVHKSYPFWFTGKNTAVKDYQETLNTMFTATISGNAPDNSLNAIANSKATSSMRDIVRYNYSPRSNQSSQGAEGKTYEPNANAAELIYNASDLAEAKVTIIGDPAWIQQGSMFKPVTEGTVGANTARTGFEPDGTISFDTQQVLFEMVWQRPEDYDLGTGLADPYSRTSQADGGKREPLQSRVYIATKVVSEFKGGAFTQTLHGSLFRFPVPNKTNTANPAAATSGSDAATGNGRTAKAGSGNVTKDTAARTGVGLTPEAARNARTAFASKDPRLLTNSDGGKAAILGSQGAYRQAQFAENAGGAAFGNPSITRQGITAGANLQSAGPPSAPTDGSGNSVDTTSTVAEEVGNGPPKLPNTGRPITPGSLRDIQRQAQLARQNAPGTNPSTTTNPATQQIAKD